MSTWQDQARKSAPAEPLTPAFPLHPYQKRVIADPARLIGWVKGRQIGGSTVATLKMVLDGIDRKSDWNTMSRTGRQAKKLLRKAARHVEAIDFYLRTRLSQRSILEKPPTSEEILLTQTPFRTQEQNDRQLSPHRLDHARLFRQTPASACSSWRASSPISAASSSR